MEVKCKACDGAGTSNWCVNGTFKTCDVCGGTGHVEYPMMSMNGDEYTGEWERHECEECNGTGEIDEYKLSLDFQKFFPDMVRNSREFYIRTCPTEKLVDIIYDLIRWNKPIHGVFMDNTDAENKKFIKMWLQGEYKE